ncbi:MAG: HAD family hydrolase [Bacilli bacterium]|nr:HAD family hydrolase [Bacilli bacterium]MDD4706019.1 HAD family hydrolase [Bacilli bacterium]
MELNNKKIAIFDFDGTITFKDSFNSFLIYTFGYFKFTKGMIRNSLSIIKYILKLKSNSEMKEKIFTYFYKNIQYDKYLNDCILYSHNKLPSIIRPDMLNLIYKYKEENVKLIILSASFKEWIEPWAKKKGFYKIICSEFSVNNGLVEGVITEDKSCYGLNKVNMLMSKVPNLKEHYIIAYGDSKSDKYFMDLANEKYYVR